MGLKLFDVLVAFAGLSLLLLAGMALLVLPIAVNSALPEVSSHALTHLRNDPPRLG